MDHCQNRLPAFRPKGFARKLIRLKKTRAAQWFQTTSTLAVDYFAGTARLAPKIVAETLFANRSRGAKACRFRLPFRLDFYSQIR